MKSLRHLKQTLALFLAGWTLLLNSCSLPQWRILQKKVPPPVTESAAQLETQRRAADLIARKIEKPESLKPVAVTLSQSLGAPQNPINEPSLEKSSALSVEELTREVSKYRKMLAKQNEFLAKYQGHELEDTGLNIFAPVSLLGVTGTIVLLVLCPGALTVALFVIRRLRSTVGAVASGIESFKSDHPQLVDKLHEKLGRVMDSAEKKIVEREKRLFKRSGKRATESAPLAA